MRLVPIGRRLPPEFFDVVDAEDNVVGRRPGSECVKRGLRHRAVAVLLFDEKGRLYIQKRADSMGWYPGYWTLSVMGHVSSGETYGQAATRELREELGVECQLKPVAKVRTPNWPYKDMVEREYLFVFDGNVKNPRIRLSEETKEGRFIRFEEFVEMAKKQSGKLTPDTLLAFDAYQKAAGSRSGSASSRGFQA